MNAMNGSSRIPRRARQTSGMLLLKLPVTPFHGREKLWGERIKKEAQLVSSSSWPSKRCFPVAPPPAPRPATLSPGDLFFSEVKLSFISRGCNEAAPAGGRREYSHETTRAIVTRATQTGAVRPFRRRSPASSRRAAWPGITARQFTWMLYGRTIKTHSATLLRGIN